MEINKRSITLIAILSFTVAVTGLSSLYILYNTALKEHKVQLMATVSSNAQLIEAIARYNSSHRIADYPNNTANAVLEQIRDSQMHFTGIGETGEFVLASRTGDQIVFLLPTRHKITHTNAKATDQGYLSLPMNSQNALPMQQALRGKSGTMIALDYRKEMVIAAYAPITELGYGMVAKIDLKEIQAPFIKAGLVSLLIALILISFGSYLYLRIQNTAIKELKERDEYNRTLFESSTIGLALCDMDGTLIDINTAFANIIGREIEETKYLSYWDITPRKYEVQEGQQLGKLKTFGQYGPYEKEYIHKDGHLVPVNLTGQLIKINGQSLILSSVEDITHRVEISNSLQQAIEFTQKAIGSAPIGMSIYNQSGDCIEANEAIADMIGVTRDQLISQNMHEIACWKDSGIYDMVLETLKYRQNNRIECLLTNRSGKESYFEVLSSSFNTQDGSFLLIILNDIAQRKKIELALIRSEETFARAQAIANIGSWDWNVTTGEIAWSDEIFRIFGLQSKQFTPSYDAFLEYIHPDDRQTVIDAVNESVEKNLPYNVEHRVVNPSGEIRIVHEQGVVYFENEQPVRMIGTVHDITELRQADQAHKQQVERNEMILKTAQDGYWIVSTNGLILDVNDAYSKMIGYSKSELIGMNISELDVGQTEEIAQDNIEKLASDGFIQFETRHCRKDSQIINVEVSSSLAQLDDETYLVTFFKDITERKQNEIELNTYRENLEQLISERTQALNDAQEELVRKERLATLGQLTATVSHELRNPLSAMNPSIYLLKKLCPLEDEKVKKAIDILERSVMRCDHIVDELLNYTRISSVHFQSLLLNEWLNSVIEEQEIPKAISIIKHYQNNDIRCSFDPNILRRAIINVIENAQHAMRNERSGKIIDHAQLTLSTQQQADRTEIIISDTGCGISEEQLPKIFEPLFSTKVYGVGLGMPTIQQIMKQHRGGIDVSSQEGEGTTVTLWLPCPENNAKPTKIASNSH